MKERGILFSAPMVHALLDGRKSVTRRIVKPQPPAGVLGFAVSTCTLTNLSDYSVRCPYGVPGDRLWVRETWGAADQMYQDHDSDPPRVVAYRATKTAIQFDADPPRPIPTYDRDQWNWDALTWRPSIFMPRWASRITLEVTEVRAERLHEITEADAKAEGVPRDTEPCDHARRSCAEIKCLGPTFKCSFANLWEEINGDRAPWRSNPWVWVVAFKRVEQGRA